MQMTPSRVLAKLRAGKVANCTGLNMSSSRAASIAAMTGFDCLWLGREHRPNDLSVIEKQILATKEFGADTVVRVPRGSCSDYIHPLEMDATGIMVPHVMSAADARNVVQMTRFYPIGRRPIDGGNADGRYCSIPMAEYVEQANRERFVMIQIEDPEPLDELDEICSIDGIDIVFFGPGDFSHAIGDLGKFTDPRIDKARRQIAETAIKHGKFAGTVAGPANIKEIYDIGYRFIAMGADVLGYGAYCKEQFAHFGCLPD